MVIDNVGREMKVRHQGGLPEDEKALSKKNAKSVKIWTMGCAVKTE
jgi:hypothetical protein